MDEYERNKIPFEETKKILGIEKDRYWENLKSITSRRLIENAANSWSWSNDFFDPFPSDGWVG